MMKRTIARNARLERWAALLLVGAMLALPACDILDVDNPNNLLEEDIQREQAATALVNGALSVTARAVSRAWQPVQMIADELVWIGSRDAWQQFDFGFVANPSNEFTDENFPFLGEASWTVNFAESTLLAHVAETPTDKLKTDLARAHLYAGAMFMVLGETQQDFAFSDKKESGPPVGESNMSSVLDEAIAKLTKAVTVAREVGNLELETRALAFRARARHSRAIWDKIKPTPQTSDPLVNSADAVADAQAVIGRVASDWNWQFEYSSETITNNMANWINNRGENQFDTLSVVTVQQSAPKKILGVRLLDPISGGSDPVILAKLTEWKSGAIDAVGTDFPPLTLVSARLMHLILAEDALQKNDEATFTTHINHIRAMNGLAPYSGQIPALQMLIHTRRVNLFNMGLRLNDMYRFGIQDPHWQGNSDAVTKPGTLMPISTIEIRANCHLNGSGC